MSRISGQDTAPEMRVRRILHASGYRYRLHMRSLPGRPDIVFVRRRKVIFVHGCFWHQHPGCRASRRPTSNTEYWDAKLSRNLVRDATSHEALLYMGWEIITIWECEMKDDDALRDRLRVFLGPTRCE